jgi:signal transduction histidine kinase/CheY-like chemotaxis protein
MSPFLRRVAQRYVPDVGVAETRDLQPRLVVFALGTGMALCIPLVASYALAGMWQAAGSVAGFCVSSLFVLEALRVTRAFVALSHVSLLIAGLTFSGIALGEHPIDGATLVWFVTLPTVAALCLSWKSGFVWLLAVLVWMVGLMVFDEYTPSRATLPAAPWFVQVVRLVTVLIAFFTFAMFFEVSRTRALAIAEAASKAKSSFLATVSHEIRTPMNGVLGMTEVMLEGPLNVEQRDQLTTIQRSGETLVALINDILDVSKVEAGRLTLESCDFELATLADDVVRLYHPRARAKGVTLSLSVAPDVPPRVKGDPLRLKQVLSNVVANAVKFTNQGAIRISVTLAGAMLRFEVTDTGVGISEEAQAGLFQLFQQGDASTTRRYGGTGLGLALSRQLMKLMGGNIGLTSTVGAGSVVWLELPLVAAAPVVPSSPPQLAQPVRSGGMRVLVVDDNEINLTVAKSLLRIAGCEVDLARNGLEAVNLVEQHPYALVLMDCHMPGLDGFEATRRIRLLRSDAARTPIVALTASALPEELAECRKAGMEECLTKPLSRAQLDVVLQRFLSAAVA